jgi:hypothetical protein
MNPAFPDLVKIGRTSKSPHARASELSNTGTPNKFVVVHSVFTKDCITLELQLHREFEEYRYSKDREFFCVSPALVIKKIEDIIGSSNEEDVMNEPESDVEAVLYLVVLDVCGSVRIGLLDKGEKYFINTIDGLRECSLNTYLYSEDFKITLTEYYSHLDWCPILIPDQIQVLKNLEFMLSKKDFEYCQNTGLQKVIHDLFNSDSIQQGFLEAYFLSDAKSPEDHSPNCLLNIFIDGKTLKIGKKNFMHDTVIDVFYKSCVVLLGSFEERFKRNMLKIEEEEYKEIIRIKMSTFSKKV